MNAGPRRHVLLATTVWKRPELTDAVLAYYKNVRESIADRIELSLAAVGSEGPATRELCERNGFAYLEHVNIPVTHKWNAVIGTARPLEPDGVVLVNSDDLVSANLFEIYADRLAEGCDYFGLRGTHIFDLPTERLGTWPGYEASYMKYRIGEPAGCARCFSRRLLEKTGWRLWPTVPQKNSSMDFWCTQYLKLFGFEPEAWTMEELGVSAVQVKTDVNITTFNRLPLSDLRTGGAAWQVVGEIVGPHTANALRALRRDRADCSDTSAGPADREPVHRIEDIEPDALRDQVLTELRAMRASVLAERGERP